jgi:hypothetical protein
MTRRKGVSKEPFACLVRADRLVVAHRFTVGADPEKGLNGVNLRPSLVGEGGVVICATNRHVMGVFRDVEGFVAREITLRLPYGARRFGARPRGSLYPWLGISADEPAAGIVMAAIELATDAEHARELLAQPSEAAWWGQIEIVDVKYPPYTREIPHAAPLLAAAPSLSAAVLAPFKHVGSPVTVMGSAKTRGPAMVYCEDRKDFVGLAMPMVSSLTGRTGAKRTPKWVEASLKARPASRSKGAA